ncbi:rod shape-determining protein MreD [Maricaulis salignorans]|uniref:Rod shape-determining protein MreD n=1 Tax=Maricaulis salignorans TaxID=144026 RepID=A0A1G9SAT8_9PROT|nr:rod shape-determining protein MreD [Maricaulis salignorans]SDM32460.1 rod shape-determining protein MreD [Maricaulis salignorans]
MRKSSERQTPYWAAAACALSVFLALVVQAAPTQLVDGVNIMPTWPLIAIFLWAGLRPYFMPPILVFSIGLFQDLLTGAPMGVWALAYLVSISALRFRGEDGMPRDLPPILARFAGTLVLAHAIAYAAGSLALGQLADLRPLMIEATATMLMFPLIAHFALRRRRSSRTGFIGG